MFIVWRKRPVKGGRTSLFLLDDPEFKTSDARVPWKPLRCDHDGPGRVARTPLLMEATRQDGKPRQGLLHRFATIRTCCVKEPFNRAAWWYDVERTFGFWRECDEMPMSEFLARDRRGIIAKLREVVPRPTRDGVERFTAFRVEKEAAEKADWDQVWDDLRSGRATFVGATFTAAGAGRGSDFGHEGLDGAKSMEELTRRFRKLARKCHPDTGGNAADFVRLKSDYDRLARPFRGQG